MFRSVVITSVIVEFAGAWPGIAPLVNLSDGYRMPAIAQGTHLKIEPQFLSQNATYNVKNAVLWALEAGYRHIYTTEEEKRLKDVAEAIQFVMDRLQKCVFEPPDPENKDDEGEMMDTVLYILEQLDLDYVDLLIVDCPYKEHAKNTTYIQTWKSMVFMQKENLTKSIGVSNFNIKMLDQLRGEGLPMPAVLQYRWHLEDQGIYMREYCKTHSMVMMTIMPFHRLDVLRPAKPLQVLAAKYRKNVFQFVLRYAVSKDH